MTRRCMTASGLIIENDRVLFMNHLKLGIWVYPGGHVDRGEFPDAAALREVKEETGLDAEIVADDKVRYSDKVAHSVGLPFAIMYEDVPYKDEPHIHYDSIYVMRKTGGELKLSEGEGSELRWFDIKGLEALDTYLNIKAVAIAALDRYGKVG